MHISSNETPPSNIGHFHDTAEHIPIEIHKKYTVSSKGDFTGFRNLTIDKAPTRPNESAKLFEITEVTEKVIIGSKRNDRECAKVLHQVCPQNPSDILKRTANIHIFINLMVAKKYSGLLTIKFDISWVFYLIEKFF